MLKRKEEVSTDCDWETSERLTAEGEEYNGGRGIQWRAVSKHVICERESRRKILYKKGCSAVERESKRNRGQEYLRGEIVVNERGRNTCQLKAGQ